MQIILSFYCNILRSYGNFMGVRLEIWRQIFFPIVLWDTLQCHAIRGEGHWLKNLLREVERLTRNPEKLANADGRCWKDTLG